MISPPEPIIEFHIRADESYGLNPYDDFLLNFLIISDEKDYKFLKELINHINTKYSYEEVKSNQINLAAKKEIFKSVAKTGFKNYIFVKNKSGKHDILGFYIEGLKAFLGKVVLLLPAKSKVSFKLDNMGGKKFQHECITLVRQTFKKHDCKIVVEFRESVHDEVLQLADILAGEYRRYFLNKSNSNFAQFLEKNKNLI
jgi:hypothetical protein